MVSNGESAPDFSGKLAGGEPEEFTLSDHFDEAPLVLAFFPGAYTPPCTNEMVAFQEEYDGFEDVGGTTYGVSADSAFAQAAFAEEYDLDFDLVSDMSRDAIRAYDLEIDVDELGLHGVAQRAVFVIDRDGEITYSWVADEPSNEPDYDEIRSAVESAA